MTNNTNGFYAEAFGGVNPTERFFAGIHSLVNPTSNALGLI